LPQSVRSLLSKNTRHAKLPSLWDIAKTGQAQFDELSHRLTNMQLEIRDFLRDQQQQILRTQEQVRRVSHHVPLEEEEGEGSDSAQGRQRKSQRGGRDFSVHIPPDVVVRVRCFVGLEDLV
jgi:hypothetical protein